MLNTSVHDVNPTKIKKVYSKCIWLLVILHTGLKPDPSTPLSTSRINDLQNKKYRLTNNSLKSSVFIIVGKDIPLLK